VGELSEEGAEEGEVLRGERGRGGSGVGGGLGRTYREGRDEAGFEEVDASLASGLRLIGSFGEFKEFGGGEGAVA